MINILIYVLIIQKLTPFFDLEFSLYRVFMDINISNKKSQDENP